MSKTKDALKHLRWVRYCVGCGLMLGLMGLFMKTSNSIDESAENAAVVSTVRMMQDRLNGFHNYWLLNKQPSQAEIDGVERHFDNKGWVVPLKNGKYDCDLLLELALPDKQIFGKPLQELYSVEWKSGRSCLYTWGDERSYIEIEKRVGYIVKVNFLS